MNCGHFSQLVWKGSERIGFGRAQAKDKKVYVVAQYGPPGNYSGQWKNNVFAPKDGKKDPLQKPAGGVIFFTVFTNI